MSGVIATPSHSTMHVNAASFTFSSDHSSTNPSSIPRNSHVSLASRASLHTSANMLIEPVAFAASDGPTLALPVATEVKANPSSGSYSLSQGALDLSGLLNNRVNPSVIFSDSAATSGAYDDSPSQVVPVSGEDNASDPSVDPVLVNPDAQNEQEQAYSPFEQNTAAEGQDSDPQQAQQKAEALAEQAQLKQLSQRDAEVRAHEQAHANVGGNFARAPSFKYEQGSDGKRYAVDGEVSIDISSVPGDPLATLNKMKQVYAAAMAPANPSMADIRVASEALRKMNEAKSQLAEKRVQQLPSPQEMKPLIDAENASKGIVFTDPVRSQVYGKVDDNGAISGQRVDSPSMIDNDKSPSQTIERLSRSILASDIQQGGVNGYLAKVIDAQYLNHSDEVQPQQLDFSV